MFLPIKYAAINNDDLNQGKSLKKSDLIENLQMSQAKLSMG